MIFRQLEQLHTLDGYRRYFMDAGYWQPYVRRVCRRHGFTPYVRVRAGLPGTYPTFIVDERWVVKFFGPLFAGELAFEVEHQVNELLTSTRQIPRPNLMASGHLFPESADWSWPYLIFEFISGVSIGEVYERVSFGDKLQMAQKLGEFTKYLHRLPLTGNSGLPSIRDAYRSLLQEQYPRYKVMHQGIKILPAHLIEQIDTFLLPLDSLLDPTFTAHLIHADLTRDHILGQLGDGGWTTRAVIDFGDAMLGDFAYELIALHLDLFGCDKRLLAAYLAAYGPDEQVRRLLPVRAMNLALLHRFNVLESVFETYPQVENVATLEDLTGWLWDVDRPGLNEWSEV